MGGPRGLWEGCGRARRGRGAREGVRPGRAAGTRLGQRWLEAIRRGEGEFFWVRCVVLRAPGCVYPRVHVEGCVRVAEMRVRGSACPGGPAYGAQVFKSGSVYMLGGWGWGGRYTRLRLPKGLCVFTHVDVCTHLSLGERSFACTPVCLWVPVSKPRVFLCVFVCTWISMHVRTCGVGHSWGTHAGRAEIYPFA